MKMRVTVEGKVYEVEVEMLDAPSAPPPAAQPAKGGAMSDSPPAPARREAPASGPSDPGDVRCPIAGSVVSVNVTVGQSVSVNDTLLVLEAMKMETNVASPIAGIVKEICVAQGDAVRTGQVLARIG